MKNDIVAVLRADHALLMQLAGDLRASVSLEVVQQRFRDFAGALAGHLTAVRKAVYPGLRSVGWKDVRSDLLIDHAQLTHAFAELLTMKSDGGTFADALADLLDATTHLIEQEQLKLLPLLGEHLDTAQRRDIGLEAQAYVARDPAALAATKRHTAAEWIEEARLVLGGVHAPPAAALTSH